MKRKLLLILLIVIISFSLFATDYKVGSGVVFRVSQDGEAEVVEGQKNSQLVGSQYTLSYEETINFSWSLIVEDDPELAYFDEETAKLVALMYMAEEVEKPSFVFYSEDIMFMVSESGYFNEGNYILSDEGVLFNSSREALGIFSPDYSTFICGIEEIPLIFKKVV